MTTSRLLTALLLACTLACAARQPPAPAPALAPKLGHNQPLPDRSPSESAPEPSTPSSSDAGQPESLASRAPSSASEPAGGERADGDPPPRIAPVSEEDEALCRHITGVVLAESNNAAGLSSEQIDELIVSCSLTLAQDRRDLSEAEFRRRADCVRKSATVAGFSTCKPR